MHHVQGQVEKRMDLECFLHFASAFLLSSSDAFMSSLEPSLSQITCAAMTKLQYPLLCSTACLASPSFQS